MLARPTGIGQEQPFHHSDLLGGFTYRAFGKRSMKKTHTFVLMAAAFYFCSSASATQIRRLDKAQWQALQREFPNSKVLSACMGNYTGNSPHEMVLSVASRSGATGPTISRVGITLSNNQWTVHRIDDELKTDSAVSDHSNIDKWIDPAIAEPARLAQRVKCDAKLTTDKTFSYNGTLLGRPLFFQAYTVPKGSAASTCFPSDVQYNNWDCIAYDPAERRFRLWYQQVFAD